MVRWWPRTDAHKPAFLALRHNSLYMYKELNCLGQFADMTVRQDI